MVDSVHSIGHQGRDELFCLQIPATKCFWIGVTSDADRLCKQSERCNVSKAPHMKTKGPTGNFLASKAIWDYCIRVYFFRKGPYGVWKCFNNNGCFLIFAIVGTRDQTASIVARVLVERWCLYFSILQSLHSDRGEEFMGDIILELCKIYKTERSKTFCDSRGGEYKEKFKG